MMSDEPPRGIVILEGADGTGKTTLARALETHYGAAYIHGRYYPRAWPYHLAMLRAACRESQKRLVVVDRHWISEAIYGRVYRGVGEHLALARMFYRIWYRFGALYVICAPPSEVVQENFLQLKDKRKEQYADRMGEVNDRYLRLYTGETDVSPLVDEDYVDQLTRIGMHKRPERWMHYDYRLFKHQHGLQNICEAIVWKIRVIRNNSWSPGLDYGIWNFAGNGYGKTLLVGDALNAGDGRRGVYWPFTANVNSSVYLCRALHALAVDEDDLAFVNVNDHEGLPISDNHRWKHGQLRIVALGNNARDGLKEYITEEQMVIIRHPRSAQRLSYHDRTYEPELDAAIGPEVTRLWS